MGTYLKKKISDLGAPDLFSANSNLEGISEQDLYVTEGVHQANIEVNEEGSEAAAATGVVVGVRTIRRKKSFFAGKVIDPSNTIQVQEPPVSSPDEAAIDSDQRLGETLVSSQPNVETCQRLLQDFPTAYDNFRICSKVKEAGEFLDWLRTNRNLCETSEDHYEAFTANNCGSMWCGEAVSMMAGWEREYQSQCAVTDSDNQQDCKILQNKLKAFQALSC